MKDESNDKTAAFQVLLDEKQTARVDKCAERVHLKSRAKLGEKALDFVMPLIEAGKLVNLNGQLIPVDEAKRQLSAA